MRFGMAVWQSAGLSTLRSRWGEVEQAGFDDLWVADHSANFERPGAPWFDGWSLLAAASLVTGEIRLGTLVSNPILRLPQLLAAQANTVDHLSSGRLGIGIGTGIAPFDHAFRGGDPWKPSERLARFREFVEIVDGSMRAAPEPFEYEGEYYRTRVVLAPAPVQRPRPPIIIGGQSDLALTLAAKIADGWNTHGPFGSTYDEILSNTKRQNRLLDERAEAADRDPQSVRRSLLLFGPLDIWHESRTFAQVVEQFSRVGIDEFVLTWPPDDHRVGLDEIVDQFPALRPST
jgi:alkanesulfonate monooxygenase SsuD/methylene tetrahydromethanopterin reductase-like flavin-dependent oxidoreductase (luciferase family)